MIVVLFTCPWSLNSRMAMFSRSTCQVEGCGYEGARTLSGDVHAFETHDSVQLFDVYLVGVRSRGHRVTQAEAWASAASSRS